jgi:LuxR family maltose regulon positive regulatory protein
LRSTLELIDPLVSARFPRIELAQALLCMKSGDFTRARALYACARDSSQEFRRDRPEGDDGSLQTDALLVMANLVACGGDLAPEHLAQDLASLAKDAAVSHPKLSAYARFTLSAMEYQLGRSAAARAALEGAAQMIIRVDSRLGLIYVHMHESQILRVEGQALAAVQSLRRASELAAQVSAGDSGLDRMMSILLADALNDVGDSDVCGNGGNFDPPPEAWMDINLALLGVEARRAFLEGGYPAVRGLIGKARALAVSRDLPALLLAIDACEVEYAVIAGQAEQVGQLSSLLALRLRTPSQAWRTRQATVVALSLHAIAVGKPLSALDPIDTLLGEAGLPERTAAYIQGNTLLALVHAAAGNQARADSVLQQALQQAHEGGFILPFLVLGPELKGSMRRMLGRIVKTPGEREELAVFAAEILNKLSLRLSQRVVFSAREEEVLRLVLEGKSNKVIARALFITENTVKFHLKRIFAKLDVHGRRNVIREHEKRGLLDRDRDKARDKDQDKDRDKGS